MLKIAIIESEINVKVELYERIKAILDTVCRFFK